MISWVSIYDGFLLYQYVIYYLWFMLLLSIYKKNLSALTKIANGSHSESTS